MTSNAPRFSKGFTLGTQTLETLPLHSNHHYYLVLQSNCIFPQFFISCLFTSPKRKAVCSLFPPHTCTTLTLFSHSLSFHRSIRAAFYLDSSSEHFLLSESLWKSRPLSLGSSEAMASRLSKTFRGPKAKYLILYSSVEYLEVPRPLQDRQVLEAGQQPQ